MGHFHAIKVLEVRKLTDDAVSITFKIPLLKRSKFRYQAGQYVTISANIEGEKIRRSYSLCSYPGFDEDLRIAVKRVPEGKMSNYLCDRIKAGDVLELMEPQGHFTFTTDDRLARKMIFFAAGSGITPMMSLMKSILLEEPRAEIMLFYANKRRQDVLFHDELSSLSRDFPGRLHLRHFYSRSDEVNGLDEYLGRMDLDRVDELIRAQIGHPGLGQYFLCGPESFMEMFMEFIDSYYIPRTHVRMEHFRGAELEPPKGSESVDCDLTVHLEGKVYRLTVPKGRFILDVLLDHNIDAPYSCQGGVCSTCMARIRHGKFNTDQNISLSLEDHDRGLFLSCSSYALSPEAEIDFDDV